MIADFWEFMPTFYGAPVAPYGLPQGGLTMLISSKGRYALKLMIYIAAIGGDPVEKGAAKDGAAGSASIGVCSPDNVAVDKASAAMRSQVKVSLREVAEREGISLKYLEQLVRPLMNAGLLRSVRGKGGGYVLAKPAAEVRAGDILRAAEGERSAVACEGLDGTCGRSDLCSTVKFWTGLEETIDAYVDGVTLSELAHVPEIKVNIEL